MAEGATKEKPESKASGPPNFIGIDHVSLPCRDLEEGIRFYRDVLGGEMVVKEGAFALFHIAGTRVGIGSAGTSFMASGAEYPHVAFKIEADELVRLKDWLGQCGVPSSNFWTRQGVETLMFFRDPSGNMIELFCEKGYAGAPDLPRGPARGHGTAIDVDAIGYTDWSVPERSA